jgi:hypothetical protein
MRSVKRLRTGPGSPCWGHFICHFPSANWLSYMLGRCGPYRWIHTDLDARIRLRAARRFFSLCSRIIRDPSNI